MGDKPSAPPPSAEYLQYLSDYEAQNLGAKNYITGERHLTQLQEQGIVGQDYVIQYDKGRAGGDADPNDFRQTYSKDKNFYRSAPVEGTYTGTDELDERGYYEDKYTREQEAFQAKLDAKMEEQAEEFQRRIDEQQILLQEQESENQAKIAEIERGHKIDRRDEMLSERHSAASSATDYVNTQIARERSNAALFGIEYELTDVQKADRINDYFGNIWNNEFDEELYDLFDEVGRPKGFEDFNITAGPPDKLTGGPVETVDPNAIIGDITGGPVETVTPGRIGYNRLEGLDKSGTVLTGTGSEQDRIGYNRLEGLNKSGTLLTGTGSEQEKLGGTKTLLGA